ncbi:hypothetical protein [Arthrobacter bambusae]|uniref:Uncharacterized protein n=1 Tax=Arthrobacter bambusae TaxID=1338426 RepID=A0AAW8DKN5_9MICC|nr:hypothetical protein [Arthrobacter bambusae]MDP9905643.1 hypothetical protein [Arthrobacter bambusae]MDQ0127275.1 hypothetical protein [Arthrobacter bambusae]MDQ0178617.1 hypothetical protein [Arthrobacter bambusae]
MAATGALFLGNVATLAVSFWVLGGPVAIALLAVFSLRDTRARTFAMYSSGPGVSWLYRLTVASSLAAVVISALSIANWAGRL